MSTFNSQMWQNTYYRNLMQTFEDVLPWYCYTTKTNSRTVRTQASQPTFAGKGADKSSSLHYTRTMNLARVQCEFHTGK